MSTKDSQERLSVNKLQLAIKNYIDQNPKSEIFSLNNEGKQVWVKRARKTGSNLLHRLVYSLSKNPILTPVEKKIPQQALAFESSKLKMLAELDIPVPKVLDVAEAYFVIEDCGPTVHSLLKYTSYENPQALIEQTLQALALLHKSGHYHGGSQIKNFTFKEGTIYFIDFEESFTKDVVLEDLQFRDLFLFLFSISKLKIDVDYKVLIEQYIKLTGYNEVIYKFHTLADSASWLMKIAENKTIWKILDRDTQSVYRLLTQLKNIKASS